MKTKNVWERTFDVVPDAIMLLEKTHRITRVNKAMADLLDLTPEECVNQICYELVHRTKEPPLFCPHRQLLKDSQEHIKEIKEMRLGCDFLVSVSPIFDTKGELIGSVHVVRDITERKQAEEILKESEEKFRNLAECSPNMIFINSKGKVLYANKKCEEIMGYKREEFYSPDFNFLCLIAPESRDIVQESFRKHINGKEIAPFEYSLIKKDGKKIETIITTKLINFREERVILGIVTDITERKQAERELARHHQRLENLVENRTAELIMTNEQLRHEITERKQVEKALCQSERELKIRNEISEIFLTCSGNMMYKKVLQVTLRATKSKYGTFGYFDSDREGAFICPSMTREIWEKCNVPDKEIVFKRGNWGGIWARAIKERKTLYSNEGSFNTPEGHILIKNTMVVPIIYNGMVISAIHIANKKTDYNEDDKRLLEIIANHIAPVLNAKLQKTREEKDRQRAEEALRKREKELRIKTMNLEEVNTALKIMLKKKEEVKTEIEEKVLSNIKELVVPYLEKLKKCRMDDKYKAYLNILESNLNNISSSFSYKLSSSYLNLTPTEIRVANLIRYGNRTKEVAEIMSLSSTTIGTHRTSIRKKLKIKNKKINLRTYLSSIQEK